MGGGEERKGGLFQRFISDSTGWKREDGCINEAGETRVEPGPTGATAAAAAAAAAAALTAIKSDLNVLMSGDD